MAPQPDRGLRVERPEVRAGQQPDLVLEAELGQQFLPASLALTIGLIHAVSLCDLREDPAGYVRDPPDLGGPGVSRRKCARSRAEPPASVTWCPSGSSMKAVVRAGTATVSENR